MARIKIGGDGAAMPAPRGSLTDVEHAGLVNRARPENRTDADELAHQNELARRYEAGRAGRN